MSLLARAHLSDIPAPARPLYTPQFSASPRYEILLREFPGFRSDATNIPTSGQLSPSGDIALQIISILWDVTRPYVEYPIEDTVLYNAIEFPRPIHVFFDHHGPSLLQWLAYFIKVTNWEVLAGTDAVSPFYTSTQFLWHCLRSPKCRDILKSYAESPRQQFIQTIFDAYIQASLVPIPHPSWSVLEIALQQLTALDIATDRVLRDVLREYPIDTFLPLIEKIVVFSRDPAAAVEGSPADNIIRKVLRTLTLGAAVTLDFLPLPMLLRLTKIVCRALMSIMSGHFTDFWRVQMVVALFSLLAKLLSGADTYHVMASALRSHLLPILAYSRATMRRFQDMLPDYFTAFQDLIMADMDDNPGIAYHVWVLSQRFDTASKKLAKVYADQGPFDLPIPGLHISAAYNNPDCPFTRCMNLKCGKSVESTPMKMCTKCYAVFACSKECFRQVWVTQGHRSQCQQAERDPEVVDLEWYL